MTEAEKLEIVGSIPFPIVDFDVLQTKLVRYELSFQLLHFQILMIHHRRHRHHHHRHHDQMVCLHQNCQVAPLFLVECDEGFVVLVVL